MATCYLTFTQVTRALSSVTLHPTGAVAEAITLSVSNQESTQAGNGKLDHVRVYADADCWLAIAASPDATVHTGAYRIKAGVPELFFVPPDHKVAATTG